MRKKGTSRKPKPLPRKTSVKVTTHVARQKKTANRKCADVGKLVVADKRLAAYELYQEHHSQTDIAIALGVTQQRVQQYLEEAWSERMLAAEKLAPYIREMEIERCDRMIFNWYKYGLTDLKASETILHWTERKHKILGIDISRSEIGGIGGGPIRISASALDLTKLSERQLANLEEIIRIAGPQLPDDDAKPKGKTYDVEKE